MLNDLRHVPGVRLDNATSVCPIVCPRLGVRPLLFHRPSVVPTEPRSTVWVAGWLTPVSTEPWRPCPGPHPASPAPAMAKVLCAGDRSGPSTATGRAVGRAVQLQGPSGQEQRGRGLSRAGGLASPLPQRPCVASAFWTAGTPWCLWLGGWGLILLWADPPGPGF